ncbi:MAG: LptF/LptG family permease [Treponema sp.]|nr:LptF/LptG family permease [Treponema sp.]
MKLVFYLYRRFFGIFIGALAFFCLILNIADLLMNLWKYISVSASLSDVGKIACFYVPKTVSYSVPIAVLFATAYTLSDLYAKNELTAIFACGVSLLRFTMPLLVFSILMSVALFFFEDRLVVSTYAKKQSLQKIVLKQEETKNNDKIVIMSDAGKIIYKADFYDDELRRLSDVYIVVRNDNKELDSIFRADFAEWNGSFWELSGASQYKMTDGEISLVSIDKELEKSFSEIPETFRKNTISVDEVTTEEAREYIEHLLKAGLPASEAQSIYYKKYSFPFVVFIVVFVAIGLSGKTQKNVLLVSLGLSISAVVLFYVVQMVTMLMAKFGAIPPMTGAWFPVILFIIISIILLQFART